jgi:hypothetical protein
VLKLKDGVVFLTQLRESLDDHEENQIKEGIEQVFGERLTIKFISTDSIPVSSREKKRQIIEIPLKISQISNVASILPFL